MSSPVPANPSKLIVVVLYQVDLREAATLHSLRRSEAELGPADTILLWDNSPKPVPEHVIDSVRERSPAIWHYRHTPENMSLAAVYNRAFEAVPDKDLMVIFDQDSSFTEDYFREAARAFRDETDIDLFVPLVKHGELVVSPGHYRYIKGSYWKKPRFGRVPSANTVVIGSGMAIRSRFLLRFGSFEERLRIYGVDSNFMLRYAKLNPWFYIMNVPFGHDLADFHEHDAQTQWKRFDSFRAASTVNAELFPAPVRWLTQAFIWYRWASLRLRIGSPDR